MFVLPVGLFFFVTALDNGYYFSYCLESQLSFMNYFLYAELFIIYLVLYRYLWVT